MSVEFPVQARMVSSPMSVVNTSPMCQSNVLRFTSSSSMYQFTYVQRIARMEVRALVEKELGGQSRWACVVCPVLISKLTNAGD